MRLLLRKLLFTLILFSPWYLIGQSTANVELPSTESPYATIYNHLYFLQAESYDPNASAKSFSSIKDSTKAARTAIKLKQVLDSKGLFVQLESLPRNNDFRDSTTHKYYFTPFPADLPQVYLERIDSSWYYSRETAALTSKLHRQLFPFGSDILVNLFPKIGQQQILGLALWQYFGILILLGVAFLLHFFLSRLINPLIKRLSHSYLGDTGIDSGQIWKLARYLSILLIINLLKLFAPALLLPIRLNEWLYKSLSIFATIFLVLFLLKLIDLLIVYVKKLAQSTTQKYDEQIIPIIHTFLKIFVIFGAIFHVLQLLEINVTALIAGISIGGLALALAAQDTVKNLIGSAMIFIDRPFQIGDYIEWAGQAGTVTEVGFRTTRIRTGDTSIISVPNGTIANVAVTNKGMRVFRLFHMQLGLTYDTSPALIEQFVEGLRGLVLRHPQTNKQDFYIHFNGMSASSLDIMFRCFLLVPGYGEELKAKEDLLLGILKLADLLGISFAFPSSSVYVEQFPGKEKAMIGEVKDPQLLKEKMEAFLTDFEKRAGT